MPFGILTALLTLGALGLLHKLRSLAPALELVPCEERCNTFTVSSAKIAGKQRK